MVQRHGLTEDDWELLLYVPYAVFFAVAYADGKLNYPESNVFGILAKQIGTSRGTLVGDVMAEVSSNFGPLAQQFDAKLAQGLTFSDVLGGGRKILDGKVDRSEADQFKGTMIGIAQQVAEIWPIIGRKVTAEEHATIDMVKDALGVGRSGDAFVPFAT